MQRAKCRCEELGYPAGLICGDPSCPRVARINESLQRAFTEILRKAPHPTPPFKLPDLRDKEPTPNAEPPGRSEP